LDFYLGLHQPNHAFRFHRVFISVNRLRNRKSSFRVNRWIMDSGAFSTIHKYGGYPMPVDAYAYQVVKWRNTGIRLAAVSEDFMCEPVMLERTGMTVTQHQRMTVDRYSKLIDLTKDENYYIMPVIQGYSPLEYKNCIRLYGNLLVSNAWVGVGSVCKRNTNTESVLAILDAVKTERPDLRLHGFGLKTSALLNPRVSQLLHSSDSMAWSYSARMKGRDGNSWREAKLFDDRVNRAIRDSV